MSRLRIVNVRKCSRCGGQHERLGFVPFTIPPNRNGLTWSHWAPCPTNHEPILCLAKDLGPHEDAVDVQDVGHL